MDICGTQFDISSANVYMENGLVDICSAIINAATVNLDISSATIDVFNADMNTATLNLDISSVTIDISNATINAATVNLDISSASIDVFNANMNTATLNLDISSVVIDVSNATLQVDTVNLDVSNTIINSAVTTLDVSSITIDVSNATINSAVTNLDISSLTVDVSNATINSAVTNLDISSLTVDVSNATIDICSGNVTISNVTLSGDLGVLANDDAFGRLRVSMPYTLYEFTSILGKQPDIIDEDISGSATSTEMPGLSYIAMAVDGSGSVIRQTHEYIIYQPGKSKLVYMTGVLQDPNDAPMAGVTSRIGCFDASMGFYMESSGGIVSVVKHNSYYERAFRDASNGSPVWLDPLDGTGPSGVTVNFRKAQIFVFDFEWLGVGQVRCGIVIGGRLIYYYKFTHVNQLTMPYITMAKLPLRYEIRGTTGSVRNEMRMICGTVISEGGFTPLDRTLQYTNTLNSTGITVVKSTPTVQKPLFALRVRPDFPFNRTTIKLKAIDIFNTTTSNSFGSWAILLNPTLAGEGAFINYDTNRSSVQIADVSAATVSGGTIIYSGFYSTRDVITFSTTADELVASKSITTGLSGTPDTVVLCANNYGSTDAGLYYYVTWIEYI